MTNMEIVFKYRQYQQVLDYAVIILCEDCRDILQITDEQYVLIQGVCDICKQKRNVYTHIYDETYSMID